jgi:ATP-dependent Clp protease ATP-binding subunit ClpA
LRAIGATTLNEYQKYFEKDKALKDVSKSNGGRTDTESAISIFVELKINMKRITK